MTNRVSRRGVTIVIDAFRSWRSPVLRRGLLAGVLAMLVAACGAPSPQQKSVAGEDHLLVSEGYTLMYMTVSQLKFADELLLVKIESDTVDEIISDISGYAAEVEGQLEDLAEREPEVVELELDLLPEIEVMTRESVAGERIPELLSRDGTDFERLLLLSQSGALNQTRHLARVMIDTESDPERKAVWEDMKARFDELYERTVRLLEDKYFRDEAAA